MGAWVLHLFRRGLQLAPPVQQAQQRRKGAVSLRAAAAKAALAAEEEPRAADALHRASRQATTLRCEPLLRPGPRSISGRLLHMKALSIDLHASRESTCNKHSDI